MHALTWREGTSAKGTVPGNLPRWLGIMRKSFGVLAARSSERQEEQNSQDRKHDPSQHQGHESPFAGSVGGFMDAS